ncbi:DUF218 domain-containing protein [Mycena crocata]|nr:DUF218 domain-containing protein [Mycena crocata]
MASQPSQIDYDAELVFNYHNMGMPLRPASAIFCLCSLDTRVATRAAQLFLDGYGQCLIYSGGTGKITADRFSEPEAVVFAEIARKMGVPSEKIIIEPRSTNTGENVRFTYALLKEKGLKMESFVLVQKPYMERRTYATFRKQWPDAETEFTVTSPQLGFEEYWDAENPKELVINLMVGDLVRIQAYPAKGFQIEQEIPKEVCEANLRLIAAGYDNHLS